MLPCQQVGIKHLRTGSRAANEGSTVQWEFRKDTGISGGCWRDSKVHRLGSPGGGSCRQRVLDISRNLLGPSEFPSSTGI